MQCEQLKLNFQTTRIFIGDMIARHHGYIVGVCSMIAFFPLSLMISYASSKYAVKGFMDALNRESRHEQWGVKTLTVFPYWVNTRKQTMDYLRSKVEYVHGKIYFPFHFCWLNNSNFSSNFQI